MADQFIGYPCTLLDVWQMPTGYPPPDASNKKASPKEEVKFCRGIRKTMSGRWKRITSQQKKPEEVYTIPENLRYQLKLLYVY